MSSVVAVLVAAAAWVSLAGAMPPGMEPEMLELAAALRQSCVDESGVDAALLGAVDAGGELPPDPRFKCYLKCTMESAGMLSDGAVDVEAVLALLPAPLAAQMEGFLRSCGTRPGADLCDTAFNTQKCWRDAEKAAYFII